MWLETGDAAPAKRSRKRRVDGNTGVGTCVTEGGVATDGRASRRSSQPEDGTCAVSEDVVASVESGAEVAQGEGTCGQAVPESGGSDGTAGAEGETVQCGVLP